MNPADHMGSAIEAAIAARAFTPRTGEMLPTNAQLVGWRDAKGNWIACDYDADYYFDAAGRFLGPDDDGVSPAFAFGVPDA